MKYRVYFEVKTETTRFGGSATYRSPERLPFSENECLEMEKVLLDVYADKPEKCYLIVHYILPLEEK